MIRFSFFRATFATPRMKCKYTGYLPSVGCIA